MNLITHEDFAPKLDVFSTKQVHALKIGNKFLTYLLFYRGRLLGLGHLWIREQTLNIFNYLLLKHHTSAQFVEVSKPSHTCETVDICLSDRCESCLSDLVLFKYLLLLSFRFHFNFSNHFKD